IMELAEKERDFQELEFVVDFKNYTRFFTEIKTHLIAYGESQGQPKLVEAAKQLKVLGENTFFNDDNDDSPLSFITKERSDWGRMSKFKDDLRDNKALLEKLLLYVKNPAFQEVM
ncbi:MAG: hypothetical protein JST68_30060, partial [Bacteroidetes bacterium]|nr:hypothetical protein [Bacteroidota bacterium]